MGDHMAAQAPAMDEQQEDQQEFSGDKDDKKNNKFKCRVDGCKRHLSREKTYFRRYRCCMSHSKQPAVLVEGQVRRWCQQCCCFHELSAFDGEKRNCRERLAMHNDRRNKRKNDPAATREPSSRVGAAVATLMLAHHQQQQQNQQRDYNQQPRPGRGSQREGPGSRAGGKVSRTPTSLQSALSGSDTLQGGHSGTPRGKRQRLGPDHLQQHLHQHQQEAGSHSALASMMLSGGGGGALAHPVLLNPALLDPRLQLPNSRLPQHPGLSAPSPHQAYEDALAAVSAVQALQVQQDPAAAAAAAHRIAASQSTLIGQLAAAQAAATGNPFGNPHAAQLLSASSASGGGESPGSAAAYLQAVHAAQQQQASQQQAALHAALLTHGLQNPQLQPQHQMGVTAAPPAIGHLLAAGRELSLGSGPQPSIAAAAASRPPPAGFPAGFATGGFSAFSPTLKPLGSTGSLLGRRSSGATEQQSDMSMWSRRSSNTVADTGLFLPPGAAASLAAAAAAADSSLRTASVTTPPKAPSSPLKAPSAAPAAAAVEAEQPSACQHGPMLKTAPKMQGGRTDPALPVQGHYGAMRKAGADGCTYLHTQLMQAQQAAARPGMLPPPGAARTKISSTAQQKAEWAAIVRATAAASDIRTALQAVDWKSVAELGSRVWWQRRLGSLTLLVRMTSGCMPPALYSGLLALTEMSLRLARAAATSK